MTTDSPTGGKLIGKFAHTQLSEKTLRARRRRLAGGAVYQFAL